MSASMKKNTQNTAPAHTLAYRLLSVLIGVFCIATFVVPLKVLTSNPNGFALGKNSLYGIFLAMFQGDGRLFGVLPCLTPNDFLGALATLAVYACAILVISAFVLAMLALFIKRKARTLACVSVCLFTWGVALYALSVSSITYYLTRIKIQYDFWSLILTGAGAILYFIFVCLRIGKKAIVNVLQVLLSVGALIFVMIALAKNGRTIAKTEKYYKILTFSTAVLAALSLVWGTINAFHQKIAHVDLARLLSQMLSVLVLIGLEAAIASNNQTLLRFSSIAAAISFIQVALAALLVASEHKKTVKERATAPTENALQAEKIILPASAQKEEGEEEEPICAYTESDDFLDTLTPKEKTQFMELYVLKTQGAMDKIPPYEVGGDNKKFFNAVFIYLGKHREKIPSGVLAKIYEYSKTI